MNEEFKAWKEANAPVLSEAVEDLKGSLDRFLEKGDDITTRPYLVSACRKVIEASERQPIGNPTV